MAKALFSALLWLGIATPAIALVGGIPARAQDLPSVFIWTSSDSELDSTYCTSTKVGKNWILTAAHCVLVQRARPGQTELGPWYQTAAMNPGQLLKYSFSRSLRGPARLEWLRIHAVVLPPIVRACLARPGAAPAVCERDVPLVDLALIKVEPTGSFAGAPIAKIRKGPVAAGTKVMLVGYGAEQDDDEEAKPRLSFQWTTVSDWTTLQRALQSTVATQLGSPSPNFFFGIYSPLGQAGHTNLGSGDSGGPVFDARTAEIIGVNSDGFCPLQKPDCEVASNSFFARVDTFEATLRRR